jgi:uncharacterized protein (TIGR03437 family)
VNHTGAARAILAVIIGLSCNFMLPAASVTVSAVTDAASYGPRVAPGSLATIFGANLAGAEASASSTPLPTSLGGTTVKIAGNEVPLVYVSATQINFQVPHALAAGSQSLVVTSGGSSSSAFTFAVVSQAPAIFQYGTNHAVATDASNAVNARTAPAASGSVITVYLTGQGAVNNPVADGDATPSSPLAAATATATATIGLQNATVQFLGLSPGFVGLAQANIEVPSLPTGDYPLVLNIGGIVSASAVISVSGSGTAYTSPLSFVASVNFTNSTSSLALLGNTLYVCGANRIVMVDVTTPSAPAYVGEFGDSTLNGYGSICALNTVLTSTPFLVDIIGPPLSMTAVSFAVFDLSSPRSPNLLSVTATNFPNVVDLSFSTSGYGYATTNYITYNTSNDDVIAQNGDFLAFTFTTPSEPTYIGELTPNTGAIGSSDLNLKPYAEVVGPVTAYIGTSTATGTNTTGTGALTVVDLSNPYLPIPVTEISCAPANLIESFDFSGTVLLAAGNTAGQRNPGKPDLDFLGNLSLTTFNITSIEAPVVLSSFDTGLQVNGTPHTAAFANGLFAVVSNAPSTDDTGPASLMIVDATTPAAPVLYPFQSQFGFSGILPTTTGILFAATVNGLNVYQLQLQ